MRKWAVTPARFQSSIAGRERSRRGAAGGAPRHLVALAAAAFLLKTAIALTSYGSTDVLIFEADLAKIRQDGGVALYRDGVRTQWCGEAGQRACPPFNHPPFMLHVLEGWGTLALLTGLPLGFWLRLTCAAADAGSLGLLVGMLRGGRGGPRTGLALALCAVSPIAILVSGFHGNTDAIMIFLVLVAIRLLESRRAAWLAGTALGIAASIKIVPVLLAPAVLRWLPSMRQRIGFGTAAAAVVLAGSLPVLIEAPELVIRGVLGYGSQAGSWGLSFLALVSRLSPGLAWLHDVYARYGKILSLAFVLSATVWPRPRPEPNALFMRVGFVMFVFLSMTPGFGVQYLAWLVPWVVALGSGPTVTYYLAGTAFLFAYYTATAGPFPWHLANSLERPAWTPTVILLGLMCWVVVCGTTIIYVRRLRTARRGAA
jgi:hypothetical protein